MQEFTQFLADCWRMFQDVNVPILNISFSDLYLGIFVVGIAIAILRPLLGIGGGAVNMLQGLGSSAKRGYDKAYKNSYAHYEKEKRRAADYKSRYDKKYPKEKK